MPLFRLKDSLLGQYRCFGLQRSFLVVCLTGNLNPSLGADKGAWGAGHQGARGSCNTPHVLSTPDT